MNKFCIQMFVFSSSKEPFISHCLFTLWSYSIFYFLFVCQNAFFIQETNVCTDLLTHTIYNHIIIVDCQITVELVSCRVQDYNSLESDCRKPLPCVYLCGLMSLIYYTYFPFVQQHSTLKLSQQHNLWCNHNFIRAFYVPLTIVECHVSWLLLISSHKWVIVSLF